MSFFKMVRITMVIAAATLCCAAVVYLLIWEKPFYMTPGASDYYVPGLIVVGFDKSYTTAQAVQVMEDTGLEYYKTRNVNRGKAFDRATGELFLVRVPEGEEEDYIEEFDSLPFIYAAGEYLDPDQVQID